MRWLMRPVSEAGSVDLAIPAHKLSPSLIASDEAGDKGQSRFQDGLAGSMATPQT
jgi:hypothetical protein